MDLNLLTNKSHIGSLGEFAYEKFAILKGFEIKKTGILEHDFLINDCYKIDVKSTKVNKSKFNGKRVSESINYDLIVFRDDKVFLLPDKGSPLKKFYGECLGDFEKIYTQWQDWRKQNTTRSNTRGNAVRNARKEIKKELLYLSKFIGNIRVIFRGSVSQTRWSSAPDNLPGSNSVQHKFKATFFVQMQTKEEFEIITDIYYFDHAAIEKFPFLAPDSRQSKKGIARVIDLQQFKLSAPQFVFSDLEMVKNYFQNS